MERRRRHNFEIAHLSSLHFIFANINENEKNGFWWSTRKEQLIAAWNDDRINGLLFIMATAKFCRMPCESDNQTTLIIRGGDVWSLIMTLSRAEIYFHHGVRFCDTGVTTFKRMQCILSVFSNTVFGLNICKLIWTRFSRSFLLFSVRTLTKTSIPSKPAISDQQIWS